MTPLPLQQRCNCSRGVTVVTPLSPGVNQAQSFGFESTDAITKILAQITAKSCSISPNFMGKLQRQTIQANFKDKFYRKTLQAKFIGKLSNQTPPKKQPTSTILELYMSKNNLANFQALHVEKQLGEFQNFACRKTTSRISELSMSKNHFMCEKKPANSQLYVQKNIFMCMEKTF